MLYFHFHSVQNIYDLFVDCVLLRNMFHFQVLGSFIDTLLLLISDIIPWWSKNILYRISVFICLYFWPYNGAWKLLVPLPRIKPTRSTVKAWNLNHWTARELPQSLYICCDAFYGPTYDLSWWIFCMHLKKLCVLPWL